MFDFPFFLEIERNALEKLPGVLEANGFAPAKAFVLSDEVTYKVAGERVSSLLAGNGVEVEEVKIGDSSQECVDGVRKRIKGEGDSAVFAVGGGTVIDTGKYVASLEGVNYISIPTAPSNDGIASPVAVIGGDSLGAKMPSGLIADLEIISEAPLRNIRAGIGDLVANLSAVEDWRLAHREKGETYNHFAALIAEAGALLVLDTRRPDIRSHDFLRRLVYGLVLSGIAMHLAGSSRPCSGGEHEISHAIDALYPGRALHGEQVALGTLFTLHLQKNGYSRQVGEFFAHCGVSGRLRDLNLDEFAKVVAYAPQTRSERYTILERSYLSQDDVAVKAREAGIA